VEDVDWRGAGRPRHESPPTATLLQSGSGCDRTCRRWCVEKMPDVRPFYEQKPDREAFQVRGIDLVWGPTA